LVVVFTSSFWFSVSCVAPALLPVRFEHLSLFGELRFTARETVRLLPIAQGRLFGRKESVMCLVISAVGASRS